MCRPPRQRPGSELKSRPRRGSLQLAVEFSLTERASVGAISAVKQVDTVVSEEQVVSGSTLDVIVSLVARENVMGGISDQCVGEERSFRILNRANSIAAESLDRAGRQIDADGAIVLVEEPDEVEPSPSFLFNPRMTSLPPRPRMTSRPAAPTRWSFPGVPRIVGERPSQVAAAASAAPLRNVKKQTAVTTNARTVWPLCVP
jgi:hypothetical protein